MYDIVMRWTMLDDGTVAARKASEIEAHETARVLSSAWEDTDEAGPLFTVVPALVGAS